MDNPHITSNGDKSWYQHGKYHRDDGPALEYADGRLCWYKHGKRHRYDGPALEYADGSKQWYQHGLRHRADGPAVEYVNGDKSWYLHDQWMSFDEWLDAVDLSGEDKVMMKLKYG
tara:strand:- start:363 stop:707 length:345 start_codon:yes stop_codon:yes gene_type:complete